jgi:hypothetical protein
MPNTAYCAAKFAVKGFTEALIEDLRTNAPQVRVAVVMPGHVGTDIVANSMRAHGIVPESGQLSDAQEGRRAELIRRGVLAEGASADDIRQMLEKMNADFRDGAPLSAAGAATIILDGVRSGAWRILVGQDAVGLSGFVRAKPEDAYDYASLASMAAQNAGGTAGQWAGRPPATARGKSGWLRRAGVRVRDDLPQDGGVSAEGTAPGRAEPQVSAAAATGAGLSHGHVASLFQDGDLLGQRRVTQAQAVPDEGEVGPVGRGQQGDDRQPGRRVDELIESRRVAHRLAYRLIAHQRAASSRRAVICCASGSPAAYVPAISRPASVLGSGAPAAPSAIRAST